MTLLVLLLILAVVQGLTEYLPVSSSGHLVLSRTYLPGGEQLPTDATVEVLMHLGTLIAVLLFYREKVVGLAQGVLGVGNDVGAQRRLFGWLILGTLPAVAVGLFLKDPMEALYESPTSVCVALLFTGTVLAASSRIRDRGQDLASITWQMALLIGMAQAFAIVPGVSRSGMTIVMGMALGLGVESAAAFSFLLSIPALLGAAVLKIPEMLEAENSQLGATEILLSLVGSFFVGYLALGMLLWIMRARRLPWFAPYCWLVGTAGLIATLLS